MPVNLHCITISMGLGGQVKPKPIAMYPRVVFKLTEPRRPLIMPCAMTVTPVCVNEVGTCHCTVTGLLPPYRMNCVNLV